MSVCMCVCVYVVLCMYAMICMYVMLSMYVMLVCMYVCMEGWINDDGDVCMYVCMYERMLITIHIYVRGWKLRSSRFLFPLLTNVPHHIIR